MAKKILGGGLDIFKDLKPMEIDWEKRAKENQDRFEKAKLEYEKAIQDEKIRFNNIVCPVCKSVDKKAISHSDNNGIIGPGYHSHVIFEYLTCENCGVMYKDLKKSAPIKYPSKNDYLW